MSIIKQMVLVAVHAVGTSLTQRHKGAQPDLRESMADDVQSLMFLRGLLKTQALLMCFSGC